jgi:diguanylate cyclase (GGDEF)-like protein
LTGALNRQAFFELGSELAGGGDWRLLIYADLDGLKQINDRQGHAAGDKSLEVFATAVRKAVRKEDMFARVGGDEFLIFMSVRDQSAARAVAARLHDRMNSLRNDSGTNVRCSVGGLIIPPGEMQLGQLVRLADDLMYQAKLRGAGLQVNLAQAVTGPASHARARKGARTSFLDFATTRAPQSDRRISVEVQPPSSVISTADTVQAP